jgi:hypothetical protein
MALNFPITPTVGQIYSPGELKLHNTVVNVDKDYISFTTGADPITAIYLTKYVGVDLIAFFAIQAGPAWTAGNDVTQMITYGHLGPGGGLDVGSNILAGNPLKTQAVTLAANTEYTIWVQQTGSNLTEYVLSTDSSYTGEASLPADYSSDPLAPTSLGTLTGTKSWVWTGTTWTVVAKVSPTFTNVTATGSVTASSFIGNLTGNVFGNVTGTLTGTMSGNTSGAHTGTVVGNVTGNTTGTHTGPVVGNVTGNASTATSLATTRTINGVSFNGTEDITILIDAGNLAGVTLNSTVVNSSLTAVGTLNNLTVAGQVTVNTGITASGDISTSSNVIVANAPTASTHATNKKYVDTRSIAMTIALS